MPKKRFQPEEIIRKPRHADVLLGQGQKVAEVVKALGVTDVTYYRWRQEYGGMSTTQAKRLKELERENGRLRHWSVRLGGPGGSCNPPQPGVPRDRGTWSRLERQFRSLGPHRAVPEKMGGP